MEHSAEFRRCLLEMDVRGLMALHGHIAPYAKQMPISEALVSMHMARCEVENFPLKVREYSFLWLLDQGYVYEDGRWQHTQAKSKQLFQDAVGISSSSGPSGYQGPFNHLIMKGMRDALLNGMAKGVNEPPMQKELMLKERARIRFKARKV